MLKDYIPPIDAIHSLIRSQSLSEEESGEIRTGLQLTVERWFMGSLWSLWTASAATELGCLQFHRCGKLRWRPSGADFGPAQGKWEVLMDDSPKIHVCFHDHAHGAPPAESLWHSAALLSLGGDRDQILNVVRWLTHGKRSNLKLYRNARF